MKISNPEKRFRKFWGSVDEKQVISFVPNIKGENILDLGCGYGSTTNIINRTAGKKCIGVDFDQSALEIANRLFPGNTYIHANAEALPFENGTFDTIILRDSLHHLYGESNFRKVHLEIDRVSHDETILIIYEPNINLILKIIRFLASHKDAQCPFPRAIEIMKDLGYTEITVTFNTLWSLPLSGGYVGINFVPNIEFIFRMILKSEILTEKIICHMGLGRVLCLRYLIAGKKGSFPEMYP